MCLKGSRIPYVGNAAAFFLYLGGKMKFVMKKSAFIELAKALNGDSFEKIKADIIAHLKNLEKKENQSDLKKAIEHFNELERYPHLEKSVTGELIEKAVYGLGTVREWKGKKYKKIAQGKWVRVYDKVDRGAKNAMTRLVHQAEKINTPEEMLQFVLANKQRFVDERTGRPLDIVDRLNAVIDGKNKEESKTATEQTKNNVPKAKQEAPKTENKINPFDFKAMNRSLKFNELIPEYEKQKKILNWDLNKKKKQIEKEYDFSDTSEEKKNQFLAPRYKDLEEQYAAAKNNIEYLKNELKRATERDGVNNIVESMKNHDIYDEIMGNDKPAEKKTKTKSSKEKQEMKNDKKTLDFEINDIGNSKKKVTDLEQAKNIIEIIAKKYGATEEGREKLDSFMSYNIGGTNPIFDKLYTSYGVSAGDLDDDYEAAFDMVLKNALGKDTSKERKKIDTAFATQSARARKNLLDNDKKFLQELKKEKADNKKKTANTDVFSTSDSADIDSKQVIAEPISQEKDRVEFPGTKEIKNEFEQLKRSCSTDPNKPFPNHVYYDKASGVLAATAGRRLKFIKVGDLKGFEDSQFVAVDTKGKNVVLTPQEVDDTAVFPNYKRVIPDKTAGKVKFDNKALVKKLKEMKADGAISNNRPFVDFELQKNGDVLIDGTKIGTVSGRDINEGDFFKLNSTYILNAISGDSSELNFSKGWGAGVTNDYERAMTINTGCSTSVIMPRNASERTNYQEGRDEKKAKNDKKMQKRGLSTQIKKSENSLFDYVQKSIGVLKDCHAI